MNLKEAFRYLNHLDSMIAASQLYLSGRANITKTTRTHLRSKACPDGAENETEEVQRDLLGNCPIDVVVDYMMALLDEKFKVSALVADAKIKAVQQNEGFDLDTELAVNKTRRSIADTLKRMCAVKPVNKVTRGTGFRFNAEGNQISYIYDIEESTEPDFTPHHVRSLMKYAVSMADAVSSDADRFIVETEIDLTPRFDVSDTIEESIAAFHQEVSKMYGDSYTRHAV